MKKKLITTLLLIIISTGIVFASGDSETSNSAENADYSNYPNHPITLIVSFGAGGGSDIPTRIIQPYLKEALGVPVNVTNISGAAGWVGWEKLLNAKADGYTVSMVNLPVIYGGYLNPSLQRDATITDFDMICNMVTDPSILVVKKGDPRFPDAKAFIEYAKQNELTIGTAGMGSDDAIMVSSLMEGTDLKLSMVPSSGGWKDNYSALLGGHIDCTASNIGEALVAYNQGEVDILCVFSDKKADFIPNVPVWNDLNLGNKFSSSSDRGFAVKVGTPQPIIDELSAAFESAIKNPEVVEQLKKVGQSANFINSADFNDYVKEQEKRIIGFSEIMGW